MEIETENDTLLLIGVYIPFDDNSAYRYAQLKSTLELIASIIEDNLDKTVLVVGDFNADLKREKRYDKLLNEFVRDNELDCYDYLFENASKTTYKNGKYTSHIDHILGLHKNFDKVETCEIIYNELNLSDHNAICLKLKNLNPILSTDDKNWKKFHKFAWHNDAFVDTYDHIANELIEQFEFNVSENSDRDTMCKLVDDKIMELSKLLLRAARKAEDIVCRKNKKKVDHSAWSNELKELNDKMNKWHNTFKNNNCEKARDLWKYFKVRFREQQRIEINKRDKSRILDLEKLKKMNRNKFWKIIKAEKNRNSKMKKDSNVNISFSEFSEYYSKLFFNNIEDTEDHAIMKAEVRKKTIELKDQLFDDVFDSEMINNAIKTLKKGKSTGFDYISGEMLIFCKSTKLREILRDIFNSIIKFGLILKNLNISAITPIPKKAGITKNPDDYRPISVSNVFSILYERLILQKIEHIFKFSSNQFGYRRSTSCKHASFVINEARHYMVSGGSPCYIANLDMKKAFDKLWRQGLFFKLLDKVDNIYWRAIVNYYENSKGMIRINGQLSHEFKINDGVKQGGILSPFLFNYYLNSLIEECMDRSIGAKIGPFNVSIVSYCDDITLISPSISEMNLLLEMCGGYASKWKLEFSLNKCNWLVFGKEIYKDAIFILNKQQLTRVDDALHLGLPIGSREFVNSYLKEKFKKVERSFYSLYTLGCKPNGLNPLTIAEIYKTFCQSILLYGFEIFNYSNATINEVNIRQNILIKHSIGLSKYVRTTHLFSALKIKSIKHLIYQHKLSFVRQLFNVNFTRRIFFLPK